MIILKLQHFSNGCEHFLLCDDKHDPDSCSKDPWWLEAIKVAEVIENKQKTSMEQELCWGSGICLWRSTMAGMSRRNILEIDEVAPLFSILACFKFATIEVRVEGRSIAYLPRGRTPLLHMHRNRSKKEKGIFANSIASGQQAVYCNLGS
ncbi:hypothetical protein OIU78_026668 [Salix suchowensis]|nr:hypothetical protein OIU78_026668 [Salix suchowensis]